MPDLIEVSALQALCGGEAAMRRLAPGSTNAEKDEAIALAIHQASEEMLGMIDAVYDRDEITDLPTEIEPLRGHTAAMAREWLTRHLEERSASITDAAKQARDWGASVQRGRVKIPGFTADAAVGNGGPGVRYYEPDSVEPEFDPYDSESDFGARFPSL